MSTPAELLQVAEDIGDDWPVRVKVLCDAADELERLHAIERAAWAVRDSQPEGSPAHKIARIILGEAS